MNKEDKECLVIVIGVSLMQFAYQWHYYMY